MHFRQLDKLSFVYLCDMHNNTFMSLYTYYFIKANYWTIVTISYFLSPEMRYDMPY